MSVEKIQVWLKSDKNEGHFKRRPKFIYGIWLNSSVEWEMFRIILFSHGEELLAPRPTPRLVSTVMNFGVVP